MNNINIILQQQQFSNIILKSYTNNSLDTTIIFIINNITIKILTDFNSYCYSDSEYENIKLFNINIIFLDKTELNIITELHKIFINRHNNIDNYFAIHNKIKNVIKHEIDYNIFKLNLSKYYDTNILLDILHNKDIIFNKKELINILVNELRKINSNLKYKHYITLDDIEPNILILRYIFNDTLKNKINSYFGYDYVEFKLNIKFYPYLPPKIEYSKPQISNDLLISLLDIDILKLENWNYSISIEYLLTNLGDELEKIIDNHIIYNTIENKLESELLILSYILKYTTNKIKININYNVTKTLDNKSGSGIGYGNDQESSKWNIKEYIKEQELFNNLVRNHLSNIYLLLNNDNITMLINSFLIEYINDTIKTLTLLELEKHKDIYIILFDIIEKILNNNNNKNIYFLNITSLYNEVNIIKYIDNNELNYINKIINIIEIINSNMEPSKMDTNENEYINTMKNLQYDFFEINNSHLFYDMINNKPNKKALTRIISELGSFKSSLPLNYNSTIWVRVSKSNINLFTFIISGPENTPYENGLFEFHAYFSDNYPIETPKVLLKTTGNKQVRFNPNLYESGKVCLSLLGTWSGQESEKWNSNTSTFIQIMISIQSLILIDDPYFNEPGYTTQINTAHGKNESLKYNLGIYPNTIKYAMMEMLTNPPDGFESVVFNHFKHKKNDIIEKIKYWETLYKDPKEYVKSKDKLIDMLNIL